MVVEEVCAIIGWLVRLLAQRGQKKQKREQIGEMTQNMKNAWKNVRELQEQSGEGYGSKVMHLLCTIGISMSVILEIG